MLEVVLGPSGPSSVLVSKNPPRVRSRAWQARITTQLMWTFLVSASLKDASLPTMEARCNAICMSIALGLPVDWYRRADFGA